MPPTKQTPFPNSPLALTVLEIRYPDLAEEIGRSAQQQVRAAVQERLPLLENVTEDQVELAVGAPGGAVGALMPASFQRRTHPRFFSRDRTTALVVKRSTLVLETAAYAGWEGSFRPAVAEVVAAIERTNQPDGVLRIGLRYINEIRVPGIDEEPGDWSGYIKEDLLAGSLDFMPAGLKPAAWMGVTQYTAAGDSTLTVRYGPQQGYAVDPSGPTRRKNTPSAGPFFLLDSDSFWEARDEVPEFKTGWIMEQCDRLHTPTRDFFRIAVTDRLRKEVFGTR